MVKEVLLVVWYRNILAGDSVIADKKRLVIKYN